MHDGKTSIGYNVWNEVCFADLYSAWRMDSGYKGMWRGCLHVETDVMGLSNSSDVIRQKKIYSLPQNFKNY